MSTSKNHKRPIIVKVFDASGARGAVSGARVVVKRVEDPFIPANYPVVDRGETDSTGCYRCEADPGPRYRAEAEAFGIQAYHEENFFRSCESCTIAVGLDIDFQIISKIKREDCTEVPCDEFIQGTPILLSAELKHKAVTVPYEIVWEDPGHVLLEPFSVRRGGGAHINTNGISGPVRLQATLVEQGGRARLAATAAPVVMARAVQPVSGRVDVQLQRSSVGRTTDQALWVAIRNRTGAISFPRYNEFIDDVLCQGNDTPSLRGQPGETGQRGLARKRGELGRYARGVGAYDLLRTATEVFLLLHCGVLIDGTHFPVDLDQEARRLGEQGVSLPGLQDRLASYLGQNRAHNIHQILPYVDRILDSSFFRNEPLVDSPFCDGLLSSNVDATTAPCFLELIWSYWQEEGMLVQTLNAISMRFQNRRWGEGRDPLAAMEIDPLRPLNNLLWGYIQDEMNRLSVNRRAYEYDHHYGLSLQGRAVPAPRTVDSRSQFLEAFHNLLRVAAIFFKEDDDTTVISDGFPVLNALKECHLVLSYGAHNQFGDLPWTARVEMLTQQWLLARPEMRDYLQSRAMVPYKEPWMAQADSMKTLQGWIDVSVTHFHDLAVFGEQLLLSIRYGDWSIVIEPEQAKNWARYWRPEIQGYTHAYRVVTGVDLGLDLTKLDKIDTTPPSVHLARRLGKQVPEPARLGRSDDRRLISAVPLPRRLDRPLVKR